MEYGEYLKTHTNPYLDDVGLHTYDLYIPVTNSSSEVWNYKWGINQDPLLFRSTYKVQMRIHKLEAQYRAALRVSGYKGAVQFLKAHWVGRFPAHKGNDNLADLLGAVDKLFEITSAQLYLRFAVYCEKNFNKWWDPERFPKTCLHLLPEHCPKHIQTWEPYYAAGVLQGLVTEQGWYETLLRHIYVSYTFDRELMKT